MIIGKKEKEEEIITTHRKGAGQIANELQSASYSITNQLFQHDSNFLEAKKVNANAI